MNEELKEKIIENIHDIFARTVLSINYLNDSDIEHINRVIFVLYQEFKKVIANYENEILNLECELSKIKKKYNCLNKISDNLASELLLAEVALNKITDGHAKEEMDKLTLDDVFFKH